MGSSRGRRRTEFVGIWLLPEEKEALDRAAQIAGTSMGAAVRASLAVNQVAALQVQNDGLKHQHGRRATELATETGPPRGKFSGGGDHAVPPNDGIDGVELLHKQPKSLKHGDAGAETASDVGMVTLAQICYQLFECRLVLEALPYEVDLNLVELVRDISTAQQSARQAYSAASLLREGAALEQRCDTSPSRPDAIFARHLAAVAAGARRVAPDVSRTDNFSDGLNDDRRRDRTKGIVGPRPTCEAVLRDGSRHCIKPALYLGAGRWGRNCYIHATTADRDRLRELEGIVVAAGENDERTRKEVLLVFGQAVMFSWADAHDEASQSSSEATAHGATTRKLGSSKRGGY